MSRRAVLSIAVVCLLLLAGAAVPWTLSAGGLAASVTSHLKSQYGLDLRVSGRSTFAVLPKPRIKFEQISLRQPSTSLTAEGGTLRAEIDILPLLLGRVSLGSVSLSDSRLGASASDLRSRDWASLLRDAARQASVDRLVIAGSSLRWTDRPEDGFDNINAVFAWSASDDTLNVAGSALFRGETVSIEEATLQPLALASGRAGRFALNATLHAAQLSVDGIAQAGADPRFKGSSLLKATSARAFTRWSGLDLPFGSLLRAVSVEGLLSFDRRGLSWPSVKVKLGSDALEGTLARAARRRKAADQRDARGGRCRSVRSRRADRARHDIFGDVERGRDRPLARDRQRPRPAFLRNRRPPRPCPPRRHGCERAGATGPHRGVSRTRHLPRGHPQGPPVAHLRRGRNGSAGAGRVRQGGDGFLPDGDRSGPLDSRTGPGPVSARRHGPHARRGRSPRQRPRQCDDQGRGIDRASASATPFGGWRSVRFPPR